MALSALVLSAAANATSAKISEFPRRAQVRWPTQYIVGFSLSECTPNIRLTTLRQSPRQRRTTAMAPKVENKQGRSIFRAIIIFCPRLQNFCRVQSWSCGRFAVMRWQFWVISHTRPKRIICLGRECTGPSAYCVALELFHRPSFDSNKTNFSYFWGYHLILREGGGLTTVFYRQDQAQRQGWRCCQSSSEGCRRTLTQSKILPLLEFLHVLSYIVTIRRTRLARSAPPPLSTAPRPFSSLGLPSTPASRFLMAPVSTPARSSSTPWTPRVPWRRLRRTTPWCSSSMWRQTSAKSRWPSRSCTTSTPLRLTLSSGMRTLHTIDVDSNGCFVLETCV